MRMRFWARLPGRGRHARMPPAAGRRAHFIGPRLFSPPGGREGVEPQAKPDTQTPAGQRWCAAPGGQPADHAATGERGLSLDIPRAIHRAGRPAGRDHGCRPAGCDEPAAVAHGGGHLRGGSHEPGRGRLERWPAGSADRRALDRGHRLRRWADAGAGLRAADVRLSIVHSNAQRARTEFSEPSLTHASSWATSFSCWPRGRGTAKYPQLTSGSPVMSLHSFSVWPTGKTSS